MSAPAILGIDMAHCAVLVSDKPGIIPVYKDLYALTNAKSINVSGGDGSSVEFFDNAAKFAVLSKGNKTVTFVRAGFNNEEKQRYLGLNVDANGITLEGKNSLPPYVAFGCRRLKKDEDGQTHYDFVWYLKGIFRMNEENTETGNASPTIQTRTIVGEFIERQCDDFTVAQRATDDSVPTAPGFNEPIETWFSLATLNKLYTSVITP